MRAAITAETPARSFAADAHNSKCQTPKKNRSKHAERLHLYARTHLSSTTVLFTRPSRAGMTRATREPVNTVLDRGIAPSPTHRRRRVTARYGANTHERRASGVAVRTSILSRGRICSARQICVEVTEESPFRCDLSPRPRPRSRSRSREQTLTGPTSDYPTA